jgi:hypothetical protein
VKTRLQTLLFSNAANPLQTLLAFKCNLWRYGAGSRKAVLLRLDQDTSSAGFVKSMGAERAVTLIAVAKSDSFDEAGAPVRVDSP